MSLSSLALDAFMTLARTGNFTRAAEALHITQSALSQRILKLESELGTTLVIRDRAGLRLTETAEELLRYCQTKAGLEREFMARLKADRAGELAGPLRIAGFSSVMRSVILAALAKTLTEHSKLQLEFLSRELEELPDLLKRSAVDFVITDGRFVREDVESIALGFEHNVLVEKKGYKGPDVYLDHHEGDEITLRYLKLAKKDAKRPARHYLDDVYGLLDGVRAGLGRAVLPLHLLHDIEGLRILAPELILKTPVVLNFYRQPYYSRLHQVVVETLKRDCPIILKG